MRINWRKRCRTQKWRQELPFIVFKVRQGVQSHEIAKKFAAVKSEASLLGRDQVFQLRIHGTVHEYGDGVFITARLKNSGGFWAVYTKLQSGDLQIA